MLKTLQHASDTALSVTAAFEGCSWGGVTGNFDGQGISAFILSWAAGQGKLQPVIKAMAAADPALFSKCCTVTVPGESKPRDVGPILLAFCNLPIKEAIAWAVERQKINNRGEHEVLPPWPTVFRNLGEQPAFRAVQRRYANEYLARAIGYCRAYNLRTERALCLFFDICVQMGSIKLATEKRIHAARLDKMIYPEQLAAIAREISLQADAEWAGDVLRRKMTIVTGKGIVHGTRYDLKGKFDLTDDVVV